MSRNVAIIGAGVSGLTCGVVLAELGHRVEIFADETGDLTTSSVAAAMWFPYHCEPRDKVIPWALETYRALVDLTRDQHSGVSMIELRQFSRIQKLEIEDWAVALGAKPIDSSTF